MGTQYGGQKAFSFLLQWVLGMELRSANLHSKPFCLPSLLINLIDLIYFSFKSFHF